MKRSEMIKVLQNSFIYWMNCPDSELTPCNDEEMYSRILADLEKAGMGPPFSYTVYQKVWRLNGDGRNWEPEVEIDDKEWRNRYGKHE